MTAGTGITSQFGFAREATEGTYDTPDHFLEIISESLQHTIEQIPSRGIRSGRRFLSVHTAGAKNVSGTSVHELTTDDQALLWEACLGGTAQTTGVGPYTHVITPGEMASYTIQVGRSGSGGTTHPFNYLGCRVASWELACAAGELPILTVDWVGEGHETSTALETVSYSTPTRLAFTHGAFSVAGGEVCIDSFSIRGNNGLNTQHKICSTDAGNPTHREADFREVTGTFTADFADLTQYNRLINSTEVALSLAFTSGTESVTLAGNMRVQESGGPTIDGPGITKESPTFALIGSTDANALTVTVINSDSAA